jgi:hypothetical protein
MSFEIQKDHPLRKLFSGMIEQVFMSEVGICDPQLTDYLGDMLTDFVHVDRIYRMQGVDGRAITEVSRIEADAFLGPESDSATRTLVVNRFIGDFTLFWTGVYPEHLRLRPRGSDRLREYLLRGKRSYGIAGELAQPASRPPGALLRRLSEEFEACVHGLNRVRTGIDCLHALTRAN